MEKIKKKKISSACQKQQLRSLKQYLSAFLLSFTLGCEHQNPTLKLSWEYSCHSTGALHLPKRNNTNFCHKCAEDYCSCLHHKLEIWPRLPPSSRGSALGSSYPSVKAEKGKNWKFIRGTWVEMKMFKTEGIIFPWSLIFINISSKRPLTAKAFCEKSLLGSANKASVSVRMRQKARS